MPEPTAPLHSSPTPFCLPLSAKPIKSENSDSRRPNAHKNTHSELTIRLSPSAAPLQNVYLSSDSTHRARQATVAPFQQQHWDCVYVCLCVCVHAGIHCWACVFRAEGFVYGAESHTYTR